VGALAQVTQIIGDMEANIENLTMVTREHDFYDLDIVVEVNGIKHLTKLMKRLRNASLISMVERQAG